MKYINWFFSKTYKHTCPDGTVIIIHKDINDVFPLVISDSKKSFEISGLSKKVGSAKLKTDLERNIKGLLFGIDEQNKSLMMNFRFAYSAFLANPCEHNVFLKEQSVQFSLGQQRLQELKMQIIGLISLAESSSNNHDEVQNRYQKIADKLFAPNLVDEAKNAIKENREIADQWATKGGNNG